MNLLIQNETQVAIVINNCIIYLGDKFGSHANDIDHPINLIQSITSSQNAFSEVTVEKTLDVTYIHQLIHLNAKSFPRNNCTLVTNIVTSVGYNAIFMDNQLVFLADGEKRLTESLAYGIASSQNAPVKQLFVDAQKMVDEVGDSLWTFENLLPVIEKELTI